MRASRIMTKHTLAVMMGLAGELKGRKGCPEAKRKEGGKR
jgi:hypothetical protein